MQRLHGQRSTCIYQGRKQAEIVKNIHKAAMAGEVIDKEDVKRMIEDRNVNVINDAEGNKIVLINDIRFKGKRKIDWDDVRFALPVYEEGVLVRYNIFGARLLVNYAANGKKYLYDILAIKKETSRPQQ